ncbi:peptidyl-tRNA hydrolase ICT1, mitochondrial [Copidosoma floridanum]|uniref:peptidyl-tRNA hydrolase ICT1, mitochondrial n=1 Tax=Copidosoma floridanum TaxID=29053 RepID=UPI0006C940B6|nr:peptidyl-tRNA hydrolase ICT1, mitochondrial [Copidosoma floridanum]
MNYIGRQCLKILKSDITNRSHLLGLGRLLSYKSAYALENLYPKSNLNLYTPQFAPEDPNTKFSGYIPLKELDVTYSTSSGPGGQNVNRVNTKVDLRFHVQSVTFIDDEIKKKLFEKHSNRINKHGYFVIKSELTRSQQLNMADALQKLRQIIRELIVVPEEPSELAQEKMRKREVRAARERVFAKRMRSQVKNDRRALTHD